MKVVKFEMNFEDIRNIIRKHNSSEYGKEDNPIVLFPSNVNDIANEILKIHRESPTGGEGFKTCT